MSALAFGDDAYGRGRSIYICWDREVTDSPHRCGDLHHNPHSLHHGHSWDHTGVPELPPVQGRMAPERGWLQECGGLGGMGPGSRCGPDSAQHRWALETQRHVLSQSAARPLDPLRLYSERQLQHCFPGRPPRQPFLLDSSDGLGCLQKARVYPDASCGDYWPTPARPLSAQLCSLFPYGEVNHGMALYPDVKGSAILTLLSQRHRNL